MSDEQSTSQLVLDKIKKEHITPKPKWEFLAKNYFIWSLGVLALILGGLAVSVIIYMLRSNDWEIYDDLANNFFEFILLTLPYFWLIVLVLFVWLVNLNIKHTKDGYKYNVKIITLTSVFASILLGVLLYAAGIGNAIDDVLSENAPFYRPILNRQIGVWSRPERGLLIGIIASTSGREFGLFDLDGKTWNIDFEKASNSPFVKIINGERVKLIGQKTDNDRFEAWKIFPVGPGSGCFNNSQIGGCHLPPPERNPMPLDLLIPLPLGDMR